MSRTLTATILQDVAKRFDDPNKWSKGTYSRSANGWATSLGLPGNVFFYNPWSPRLCAETAIRVSARQVTGGWWQGRKAATAAIRHLQPFVEKRGYQTLPHFNDGAGVNAADVQKLIRESLVTA